MDLTDQQLIQNVLGGDTASYETLLARYRSQLYAATLQRCSDPQDAKDILQETIVKAYLNLDRYDPSYAFGQWIHTIARNLFIDYTRKKKSGSMLVNAGDTRNVDAASDTLNPEERIISSQSHSQLSELLEKLPPHYREMLELRFWSEYSYEEIAEKLGKPIGTVKTQIHRARERLCRMILSSHLF